MTIARVALASVIVLGAVPGLSANSRDHDALNRLAMTQSNVAGSAQGAGSGTEDTSEANIRLDVTINDESVGGPPVKKTVSIILANGGSGRVRSTDMVTERIAAAPGAPEDRAFFNSRAVQVNLDAEVVIRGVDKIRTTLTLEYAPGGAGAAPVEGAAVRSPLNQSVTVNLTNGKPLVITRAADPLSDRKVTVEVTATILR